MEGPASPRPATNPDAAGLASSNNAATWVSLQRTLALLLLTIASILANGYHYATDDASLYLPAILQRVNPALYPANDAFVRAPASLSIYPAVVAVFGRNVETTVFVFHVLATFILLAAAHSLARQLFTTSRAAWSAVCVLAFVTPLYAAGTSIPLMDPYFTARTLSTPLTLVALAAAISKRWPIALLSLALAFAVHPLMAALAAILIAAYAITSMSKVPARIHTYATVILPFTLTSSIPDGPAHQAMQMRTFFDAQRWSIADWSGVFIPLGMLLLLGRIPLRTTTPQLRRLARAASICGLIATVIFVGISFCPNLETFERLQPMRIFQLIYIVMFLAVGGLLGEYILRAQRWRWAALILALSGMDYAIAHAIYPASPHIEWLGAAPTNPWLQAFAWAKNNTPPDALFALPPDYINAPGEDRHGFRAFAQRSALADQIKDSSLVSIYPSLAPAWQRQTSAEAAWPTFTAADFRRLAAIYPITWIIVEHPQDRTLICPYRNQAVAVCQAP